MRFPNSVLGARPVMLDSRAGSRFLARFGPGFLAWTVTKGQLEKASAERPFERGYDMKVHFEVDMTPEEARRMMGLPDVVPLQEKMMEEMQARMKAAFDTGDPEAMMQAWMPFAASGGVKAFEQFQKFLWDSATQVASGGSSKSKS